MNAPTAIRPDQVAVATITYTNMTDANMPAPILLVDATNGVLKLPDQSSFGSRLLEVFADNPNGPAGVLPPGATGTIEVDVQSRRPRAERPASPSTTKAITSPRPT